MPLPSSVGACEASVGPLTFLAVSGCGTFQGLPNLFLEDPPVGPTFVPHIVPMVSTVAVDLWGDDLGHPLWHFVLRTRRLVVGVWFDGQGLLVCLVVVALPQRDPGISLLFSTPLYVRQIPVQGSWVSREDGATSRVLTGELRHQCHMEGLPVAYHLLFSGEGEPGSPEGPPVLRAAHITHRV